VPPFYGPEGALDDGASSEQPDEVDIPFVGPVDVSESSPRNQSKLERRREAAESGGLNVDPEAGIEDGSTSTTETDQTDPPEQSKLERRREAAQEGGLDVDPEAGITYGPTATDTSSGTDPSNDGQPEQDTQMSTLLGTSRRSGSDGMSTLLVGVAVLLAILLAAGRL